MSSNQSRTDRTESQQYRNSSRSNRNFTGGGSKASSTGSGGGATAPPPSSVNSNNSNTNNPALSTNRSFKKHNNVQGGQQSRGGAVSGQAQSPSYPSAARISDSQCYPQYAASLKCLEEFNQNKSKCQQHFDIYKECKKKEREERLERNRTRSLFS